MSGSHIDTERLTDSAVRGPAWTDAEAEHLAGCSECGFELEILAVARRLGTTRLAGLDLERVAGRVRRRLESEPQSVTKRVGGQAGRWLLGLAAAAAVVLAVRTRLPNGPDGFGRMEPPALVEGSVLQELDGLSEPQLEELLRSIPPASEALDHVEMVPLGDLTSSDLERVLRSMEEG